MIVLDACVLIAFLDPDDAHHQRAKDLLLENADERFATTPVNHAEVLVGPARAGRLDEATAALDRIALEDIAFPADAPRRLAQLRAATARKLPDCCLILAAQQEGATVATFDRALASTARSLGLSVFPDPG